MGRWWCRSCRWRHLRRSRRRGCRNRFARSNYLGRSTSCCSFRGRSSNGGCSDTGRLARRLGSRGRGRCRWCLGGFFGSGLCRGGSHLHRSGCFRRGSTTRFRRPASGTRSGVEIANHSLGGRSTRWRGCRRGRRWSGWCRTPFLNQQDDLIADFRFNRTQLILHIQPGILAHGQQVLAIHAQLTGQREDAHTLFLLRLQAELPVIEITRT
jgi:hypothetical protein